MCVTDLPVISADSAPKPTGVAAPADALGESKRMHTSDAESKESCECPTCGRDDFKNARGMRMHHKLTHGETLATAEFECVWCGATGEKQRREVERYERNFCGMDCRAEWQSEKVTGEDHPRYNAATVSCTHCGDGFEVKACLEDEYERHFCDRQCKHEWQRENQKDVDGWGWAAGSDHSMWNGGEYIYGEGWNDEKKRAVRQRDNYECVACGMGNEAHRSKYDRALDVHHIRPARDFDYDAKRNAMNNLVTMCIPCHRKWEGIPLRPEVVAE